MCFTASIRPAEKDPTAKVRSEEFSLVISPLDRLCLRLTDAFLTACLKGLKVEMRKLIEVAKGIKPIANLCSDVLASALAGNDLSKFRVTHRQVAAHVSHAVANRASRIADAKVIAYLV